VTACRIRPAGTASTTPATTLGRSVAGITAAHFARVAGHVQAALLAVGVPEHVVAAIVATAARLQPEIVDATGR